MDECVRNPELARNAQAMFDRQPAGEKRRLISFGLPNSSWEDGEVVATFRQPFDLLSKPRMGHARSGAVGSGTTSENEIWLGNLDSNQD